ncbi:large-conductance mechanosensitive channel protein MscL [Mucilaginibacter sp. OK283]|jgi:large conductance mechanosensitive channel|uniref:large-conductance mechanosensitive channel protein MscL n=1 Tax=Mucilaginibacter sp. OK283 TaxID=1881049 RepID=UPI0008C82100|nr:large-conductance mechanosensitive channel protein MscL [Mucilaginibacter sp. OK283]SEP43309.1 large conductance mechanosensitive channel [Mucilaginibacter sp. OK283]
MAVIKEFKEFALRGNVIDLAVGVIIGAAFGKIVTSLVTDIIMPPIGLATGGVDFKDIKILLKHGDAEKKIPDVAVNIGNFINITIEFLIVAFCIFLIVKTINAIKRSPEPEAVPAPEPAPTKEEILLTEIRDLLAARKS